MSGAAHPGQPGHPAEDADRAAIRRVIEAWGFRRDSGEWEALSETFHPEGRIAVSWFAGSFADFVDSCMAIFGRSFSKHVACGSRITLRGSRAVAETDMLLFTRGLVGEAEVATQTNMRFLDRVERRGDGPWRILDRVAIYDHDMLLSLPGGAALVIPPEELAGLAPGYRFLAWRLRRAGRQIADNLPGPGTPEEAQARRGAADWLAA